MSSKEGRKRDIFGGGGGTAGGGTVGGGSFYTGSNQQLQFGSAGVLHEQTYNQGTQQQFQQKQQYQGTIGSNTLLNQLGAPQTIQIGQQQQNQQFQLQQQQQQQQFLQQQQYNQGQPQQLQQQQLQQQQYQYQNNLQQQEPVQQYYNQDQIILQQQPQNYRDPNYLPDKIDFNFYEMNQTQQRIKYISIMKFSNGTLLFQYPQLVNSQIKNEQLTVASNLQVFENLSYNQVYRIQTDKGQWFCKVSDIDRVIMILSSNELHHTVGFDLFSTVEKLFQNEDILRQKSGADIFKQIKDKLDEVIPIYETQKVDPNQHKFQLINKEFNQIEQIVPDSFRTQIIKVEILQMKPTKPDGGLTSLSDICAQFKQCSCQNMGLCFFILMVAFMGFLIYWFIVRSVLQEENQQSPSAASAHSRKHLLNG